MKKLKIQTVSSRTHVQTGLWDYGSLCILPSEFLRTRLKNLAQNPQPLDSVFISGPAGSGKAFLAYQMWKRCKNAKRPFITAECDSIKTEREFQSFLRLARSGDLFLKNLPDLAEELQEQLESLLRNPQDVRLIASGRESSFKYAKFFSKSVNIPPLRERKDHICNTILSSLSRKGGMSCSASAMQVFIEAEWKQEFPELMDCIEKCIWFARKEQRIFVNREDVLKSLSHAHIHFWHFETLSSPILREHLFQKGLKNFLHEVEAMAIAVGLAENGGNISKLARHLQVPITTLVSRSKSLAHQIAELQELLVN